MPSRDLLGGTALKPTLRPFARCLLLAAMVWAVSLTDAYGQPVVKRLLYITHSAGFVHPVLPLSETIVSQLAAASGAFTVTIRRDVTTLSAAELATYDAVAFFTSGSLPWSSAQKQALLDFVAAGRGFIGIHSATDTFYDWPEYGAMVGGYFDGHPWTQSVGVVVEDRTHPSTQSLGASFAIDDEIYQFRSWSRSRVRVLMRLDTATVNLAVPGVHRTDNDFALAWTRDYGLGRVFYTALGHRPEVWQDPRFQQHLLGGILSAMGPRSRRPADVNGDGISDLLWQHDVSGHVLTWVMGGPGSASYQRFDWVSTSDQPEWRVVATADFDRDGWSDLLWQHPTTRQLIIWYLNGRAFRRAKWLTQLNLAGWRLAAVGDLDRDGHPDLLWQHDATRQVVVWYLAGLDGDQLRLWTYLSINGVPGWSVVASADLNRDGVSDLIWQHDASRQVVAWHMGGPSGAVQQTMAWIATVGPLGWSVVGAGDLDGDRQPDLVWQHDTTRQVVAWYLAGSGGTTLMSWRWMDQPGRPGWRVFAH